MKPPCWISLKYEFLQLHQLSLVMWLTMQSALIYQFSESLKPEIISLEGCQLADS